MTFLFECISEDDYVYVNADDFSSAIETFKALYEIDDSDQFHIYIRIV